MATSRYPSAKEKTTGRGDGLPGSAVAWFGRALLFLQLQYFFRLAPEAAECFHQGLVSCKHLLVLLQPLNGPVVALTGLHLVAQLPVGHGEKEPVAGVTPARQLPR